MSEPLRPSTPNHQLEASGTRFSGPPASAERDRAVRLARAILGAQGLTIAGEDSLNLARQFLRAIGQE